MHALPRHCGHHWGQQHIHEPGVSRDHVTYCASGHISVLCVGRSSSPCLSPASEVDLAHFPYIWDRNPVLSGSIVCSDTVHVILGCYSRPTVGLQCKWLTINSSLQAQPRLRMELFAFSALTLAGGMLAWRYGDDGAVPLNDNVASSILCAISLKLISLSGPRLIFKPPFR